MFDKNTNDFTECSSQIHSPVKAGIAGGLVHMCYMYELLKQLCFH